MLLILKARRDSKYHTYPACIDSPAQNIGLSSVLNGFPALRPSGLPKGLEQNQ